MGWETFKISSMKHHTPDQIPDINYSVIDIEQKMVKEKEL